MRRVRPREEAEATPADRGRVQALERHADQLAGTDALAAERAGPGAVAAEAAAPRSGDLLGGREVPADVRSAMEPRLGFDFGQVRIHDDEGSHALAGAHGARAITFGHHVFLGDGERSSDRALVGHELAHVAQQRALGAPFVQRQGSTAAARRHFWKLLALRAANPGPVAGPTKYAAAMLPYDAATQAAITAHLDRQLAELPPAARGMLKNWGLQGKAGKAVPGYNAGHHVGSRVAASGMVPAPKQGVNDPRNFRLENAQDNQWRGAALEKPAAKSYLRGRDQGMTHGAAKSAAIADVKARRTGKTAVTPAAAPNLAVVPSPKGVAGINGALLALSLIGSILNRFAEEKQRKRMEQALQAKAAEIATHMSAHASHGALVTLFLHQPRGHPDSVIQPVATFSHAEVCYGDSPDEALASQGPALRPGAAQGVMEVRREVWIPASSPKAVEGLRTPFPSAALAEFRGSPRFQGVEWAGSLGFDDEGQSTATAPAGPAPRFWVLRLPSEIGAGKGKVQIPIVTKSVAGGSVPAVNLDPLLPGGVTACCVFPANATATTLFASVGRTTGLAMARSFVNFGKARWVRPENLKVVAP